MSEIKDSEGNVVGYVIQCEHSPDGECYSYIDFDSAHEDSYTYCDTHGHCRYDYHSEEQPMRTMRGDERYRRKVYENLSSIRIGDRVQIVNCAEEDMYRNQTFKVLTEAWQVSGTWFVRISEKGTWDIGYLEKVTA